MARCDLCKQFDDCAFRSDPDAQCSGYRQRKMTNADRIRSMLDEELADKLYLGVCVKLFDGSHECKDDGCRKCWFGWLKKEANE